MERLMNECTLANKMVKVCMYHFKWFLFMEICQQTAEVPDGLHIHRIQWTSYIYISSSLLPWTVFQNLYDGWQGWAYVCWLNLILQCQVHLESWSSNLPLAHGTSHACSPKGIFEVLFPWLRALTASFSTLSLFPDPEESSPYYVCFYFIT